MQSAALVIGKKFVYILQHSLLHEDFTQKVSNEKLGQSMEKFYSSEK